MTTRHATPEEIKHWNTHITNNPDGGNILQGKEFIELKTKTGWTARYLFVDERAVAVIEKRIPLLGNLWYCPKGPSTSSADDLEQLCESLRGFAASQGVFTVKIEPELDHTVDLTRLPLIPTAPVQLNYATVFVDLSPELDDVMINLNQKGRHAIRRAERDGVTVKAVPATDQNCQIMYDLFLETAQGAGFAVRPPDYYRDFYRAYETIKTGQLFFAYFEGQIVAGAFAMVLGTKSMYKDGASVRQRTVYGASHLLQWHVIQWAKEHGSLQHDLAGVPPLSELKNSDHPFAGLARFKTSFNKQATQFVGAFEIPVVGWKTNLWHRYIEKITRRLYYKRHRQSYY
ncbi:peptidoglycan bridge formation glycyltransferase FemA/FemB family protein [Candidatus Saccharibacteria bacterium]|nr:peptidoglycan bridge formation glycyltransferase FemA/FemB family protein [Candidatus Saccharibacteria bacterium]